jgi:hypothetical protein
VNRVEHLYLLPDVIIWVKPECCVYLNFSLTIPLLWFHLFTVVVLMHFYLSYIVICMWCDLLMVYFENKTGLQVQQLICGKYSHWEFYSHPVLGNSFQVPGRLIRERHDRSRLPLTCLVWYLTRDVYLCFWLYIYILYVMNHVVSVCDTVLFIMTYLTLISDWLCILCFTCLFGGWF